MRTVIQRFLSFNAENVASEVYWAMGLIYLILLAAAISSLAQSENRAKLAWFLTLVCLPVVGMYFYTLWTLFRADYSFLSRFGFSASAGAGMRQT